jgi:3-hydroxyacyl-CoA dehydrogenase/3a,7a,12a-trihydroxy-5b-cholest-24-enoyl-CoA hydratase
LKKIDRNAAAAAIAAPAAGQSAASASASSSNGTPNAPKIFAALKERLAKSPALGNEVGATVNFKVKNPDFATTVELGKGATTTVTISDEDLTAIAKGEATVKDLYMHGQLRVDGDLLVAHRLGILNKLI